MNTPVPRNTENVLIGPPGLSGELVLMDNAVGVIVFVDGRAGGRYKLRNDFVARVLRSYGLGTLLVNLLTDQELRDRRKLFDKNLRVMRLMDVARWLGLRQDTADVPVGLYGEGSGAAIALMVAARLPERINAVVAVGAGRAELPVECLPQVRSATLLVAGAAEPDALELNQLALQKLSGPKKLEVVAGATQLFEEPGSLDLAASLAGHWFESRFNRQPAA